MSKEGKLIIFSAPSGSGKSTIIEKLTKEYGLQGRFSVSATSRAPRGEEVDGVHYHFLSSDEFQKRIDAGDFLEYEEVYPGLFYGTLRSEVDRALAQGENVLLDIDVVGALNVKAHYKAKALTLFIQPPSIETLRQRLLHRATDTLDKIEQRLQKAAYELTFAPKFDHRITNDILEDACEEANLVIQDFLNGVDKHILLFPGSFNPMHVGHLGLANFLVETRSEIDELWMVLTPESPFKKDEHLLSDGLRAEWADQLLQLHPKIKLSLEEMSLPKPSYTIQTLEHLHTKYPKYRFSLLMGMDSWLSFPKWMRSDEIRQLASIYVYPRPGYDLPNEVERPKGVFFITHAPLFDISATKVRELLRAGAQLPYLLQTSSESTSYAKLVEAMRDLKEQ